VVVDVETTGLDAEHDRVISFAAVPIDRGRIVAAATLYGLVNPGRSVPAETVVIHGIREADLADAPAAPGALQPLAAALRGRVPVAHAAFVERAFLTGPLRKLGTRLPRHIVDTADLYRLWKLECGEPDPGLTNLGDVAAALGLPAHRRHHAMGDALTTAQCFLVLATHLAAGGRGTVGRLRTAGTALANARTFGTL